MSWRISDPRSNMITLALKTPISLLIEVLRNALNLRAEARTQGVKDNAIQALLDEPLKNALQVSELPANLFGDNSLERGILEERILPAAIELTNGDDPSYEVSAVLPEPEQQETPSTGTDQDPK